MVASTPPASRGGGVSTYPSNVAKSASHSPCLLCSASTHDLDAKRTHKRSNT